MNNTERNLSPKENVRVAAAHLASVFFDVDAGVAKALRTIKEAAAKGANIVVFPESFIPGFPIWNAVKNPIDGHEYFTRFAKSSIRVDGPEIKSIASAAASCRIAVSLGFSERASYSEGCLWNAAILISPQGEIVNHHRKLVPTFYEKLTWNRGDGAGLHVVELPFGRVGGLICGENGNPLARYSLMAQGEQIHCANYPSVWPFKDPRSNEPYDLTDAIRVRSAAHSFEAKVFTVVSAGFLDKDSLNAVADSKDAREILEASPKSASMIVAPDGSTPGGILSDEEGLVIADVNVEALAELKQHHDMAGYYNRHDVFHFQIDRTRQRPMIDLGGQPSVAPSNVTADPDTATALERTVSLRS